MEQPVFAGNVTLGLNADANPTLAGYNIYYWAKSGGGTNKVSVANALNVTISNLVAGRTYNFAATTYDASGLESPLSSVLAFTMPYSPTLSMTMPSVNQQGTNGVLTATGKASDNAAVSSVFFSLNGSVWTMATTASRWTNWLANLNLIPGTNVLRAYALDICGNCSATNTVKFVYLVRLPLTVNLNGKGSVNPNYNGALLAINLNYAITASAQSGFAFTNWTDGLGHVLTNRATLQFTMRTNLALTANFVDVQKPTMNILTPTPNQQTTNGTFTVTGRAGDNVAAGTVFYSLNGSSWTPASTVNGWTNWTANLTLTPGYNSLQAYAVDTAGNRSTTNTIKFVYLVRLPLTVNLNGKGAVNPNYNHTLLDVNMPYTISANAASGFGFTNWTDGSGQVLTNRATLQFTMATNLALTANFVDVARPTVSIITPTSNQQWTNGTFMAAGKAGDNVAVGTVYYSLNGSSWTPASTVNGWTNWTANLALTPGHNTLQACAEDTIGNFSTTNTVKFIYLARLPLTVQINGKGSVSPNYNGTLLDINMGYTMNASAASGFAFTNWTDGAGQMLTNRPTLQFAMLTNLTLTANFVDISRPSLSIVMPTSNLRVSNAVFAVTGKASDNVAVGMVYYSLNGSSWTAATTANHWTNWMASVTLLPGTNTVRAYAVDTGGNCSPTNNATVNLAALPPTFATLGPVSYGSNRFAFLISGAAGYKYRTQVSTDLVNWVSIQTNIIPFTFVDTNASRFNQRFYRSVYNP